MHLGGTIGVEPKVPLKTRDDLSMAYTPGVARIYGNRKGPFASTQTHHQAKHRGRRD